MTPEKLREIAGSTERASWPEWDLSPHAMTEGSSPTSPSDFAGFVRFLVKRRELCIMEWRGLQHDRSYQNASLREKVLLRRKLLRSLVSPV